MKLIYNKLNKNVIFTMFVLASNAELALGVLDMCSVKIPGTRFFLWGVLGIYGLQLIMNEWTIKEYMCLFGLLILGGLLYLSAGINTGIKAPIFIFVLKGINRRKLFKSYMVTMLGIVTCIVTASLLFNFGRLGQYGEYTRGFHGWRWSFGFDNPNALQIVGFWIMIYALYLFAQNRKLWILFVTATLYVGLCVATASRTGALVGGFVLIFVAVVSYVPYDKWAKILGALGIIMISGMVMLSLWVAADWRNNSVLEMIDRLINGRISVLGDKIAGTNYELPFICNWKLFSAKENKNWYDMGYVQIFYYYGIVPACMYLAFVVGSIIKAWRGRQDVYMVLIIGLCLYLFMETHSFSNYITKDLLLIIAADMLWRKCDETVDNTDYSSVQRGKVYKAVS